MITLAINRKTGELVDVKISDHPDDKPIDALIDALAKVGADIIIKKQAG